MAVSGGARPSARLRIVDGNLVLDMFQGRQPDALIASYKAVDALRAGQNAYVQAYGDELKTVWVTFEPIVEGG